MISLSSSMKAWDAELPKELVKRWQKWEMKLPVKTEVPRALVPAENLFKKLHFTPLEMLAPKGLPQLSIQWSSKRQG